MYGDIKKLLGITWKQRRADKKFGRKYSEREVGRILTQPNQKPQNTDTIHSLSHLYHAWDQIEEMREHGFEDVDGYAIPKVDTGEKEIIIREGKKKKVPIYLRDHVTLIHKLGKKLFKPEIIPFDVVKSVMLETFPEGNDHPVHYRGGLSVWRNQQTERRRVNIYFGHTEMEPDHNVLQKRAQEEYNEIAGEYQNKVEEIAKIERILMKVDPKIRPLEEERLGLRGMKSALGGEPDYNKILNQYIRDNQHQAEEYMSVGFELIPRKNPKRFKRAESTRGLAKAFLTAGLGAAIAAYGFANPPKLGSESDTIPRMEQKK